MNKRGFTSLSLSILIGGSLAACAPYPNTPTTGSNQLNSSDPYISSAQMAMASYAEADANFSDSQAFASQGFAVKQVLDGSVSSSTDTSLSGSVSGTGTSTSTSTSTSTDASAGTSGGSASGSANSSTSAGTSTNTSTGTNGGTTTTTSGSAETNTNATVDTNDFDAGIGTINAGLGSVVDVSGSLGNQTSGQVGTQVGTQVDSQVNTQISSGIDTLVNTQISTLNDYAASANLFNQASANFNSQLLGTQGVELDSSGKININLNRLRADIMSDLRGDAELSNASLDLNGQLNNQAQFNLTLNELQPLGFSASSSGVAKFANADGTNSESMLLTFSNAGAGLTNRVRVTSKTRAQVTEELNLRLESQAPGFTRIALREVSRNANGQVQVSSDMTTKLSNGTTIDLLEKRFVSANGAGAGIGSFTITTSGGQSFSGVMRTIVSANGKLMMIFEPEDTNRGRLVFQETTNANANLAFYNHQGQLGGNSQVDLKARIQAMAKP